VDDYIHQRLKAERDKVLGKKKWDGSEPRPRREPKHITTVDGDLFQVVGEEQLYADPCKAIQRANKLKGANVIRLSDGKVIAHGPDGWIPSAPKEFT
jgi:hypothetical protein